MKFKSFLITEENGDFKRNIIEKDITELPAHDTLIKVSYSSLNYKDALSSSGNKGVTRNYPHTPGIDAAGVIVESSNENLKPGTEVLVTGYDFGMNTSGGYQEYIKVPSEWVVPLPKGLTLKESMIYGTAGLTAAISVYKLVVKGEVKPEDGEILVTGATGGVGSIATMLLKKLGYEVVAVTGKLQEIDYLLEIGASKVIHRDELAATSKPMLRGVYAGVIDTVGGNILSTALKALKYNGVATACGNAAGVSFESSVFPFILRGVTLYGVDSVEISMKERTIIWEKLAQDWKVEGLDKVLNEVTLNELSDKIDSILAGTNVGRVLVKL
ncbi:YhdH/YhfP family quinone oxidoreductase [Candidatus Cetobacterium colombiensis]|uniref:YhdH/YhfP family quinone oxidoreductase n=1 Tax=Candidatus Cetobacterium colombiensis TaxID=3073100 RepID=A0ABU4WD45_9FUSO|nr:YhdH/YhfP family quinone oxidoreductase [Candidatus Cetobacterium colombiensis]MDX8337451.1 YhdH/YhfP family quinone oxidoreductase [Candidatus Cetobacterium colombiensis]